MITRRVNLSGVSYQGKSIKNPPKHDSPGYHTLASQSTVLYTGVSNPSESVFFPKILITRGNLDQNQKYFKPFWGSPKADSNNEKNESRKSRLTVPVGGVITLVQQPYLFFY